MDGIGSDRGRRQGGVGHQKVRQARPADAAGNAALVAGGTDAWVLEAGNSALSCAAAKRAFEAMMTMSKIDIARIEAALKG